MVDTPRFTSEASGRTKHARERGGGVDECGRKSGRQPRWRPRTRRAAQLTAAILSAGVTLAACGSSTPGVNSLGATTTTGVAQGTGGSLVEYATCMRSHGVVDFPDSGSFASSNGIKAAKGQIAQISKSDASSPTFRAAQRTCSKYYGPTTSSNPKVSPKEMQKLLAVSRCMRAHGVTNFPDPNATTGELTTPPGVDKNSPLVIAALTACAALGRAAGLGPRTTTP
ncbi:MAG TPA: hypothetical protein VGZ04_00550 [Acidimicrobiales bacterium]|nr:hypothetical protein [Acidimicrobiales bacterium]